MYLNEIPPKTLFELSHPAPPGARHEQAKQIACSLIACGNCAEAVFAALRRMYDATMGSTELWRIVDWALAKFSGRPNRPAAPRCPLPPPVTAASAVSAAMRVLNGFECDEYDVWEKSPVSFLKSGSHEAVAQLRVLFNPGELVNVATRVNDVTTRTVEDWVSIIEDGGVPAGADGCLFRPNPVTGAPSGPKGGYTDADIAAHRYVLLESDLLPYEIQLSLLAYLPLPITSITWSGGRSLHALLRIDAQDATTYRSEVARLFASLRALGFDAATLNASRMTRLAGAKRGGRVQALVYINPGADPKRPQPIIGGAPCPSF